MSDYTETDDLVARGEIADPDPDRTAARAKGTADLDAWIDAEAARLRSDAVRRLFGIPDDDGEWVCRRCSAVVRGMREHYDFHAEVDALQGRLERLIEITDNGGAV